MDFSRDDSVTLPKLTTDTNLVLIYSAIKVSKTKSDKEFSHSQSAFDDFFFFHFFFLNFISPGQAFIVSMGDIPLFM